MLVWSWGTWPDVLIDFGRELYVPWQLSAGKVLYTDVAYFNGPLSPYFNSLCFRIFGASVRTIVACNLAIITVLIFVLYDLLSRIGDRVSATAACLVFVAAFAFGQLVVTGNYNFVCPYSHELTHGTVLSLAGIWFLSRYHARRNPGSIVGCGVSLGLVLLTKPEVSAAAGVAVVLGLGLTLWAEGSSPARCARLLTAFAGSVALPPVLAVSLLAFAMPLRRALVAACGAWQWVLRRDVASLAFYQVGMGTRDPWASIVKMLPAIGVYAVITLAIAGVGLAGRAARSRRLARCAAALLGFASIVAAFRVHPAAWFSAESPGAWFYAARPLPVLMAVLGAAALVNVIARRESLETILRLSTIVFALVLLGKIILNTHIYHYGFALAMPATLIGVVGLTDWLPAWVKRWGGDAGASRAAALGLLLAAVIVELQVVQFWFGAKTTRVGRGPDSFLADWRGPLVNRALDAISDTVPADATLSAIPEGVMLNYLARRVAGVPHLDFTAPAVIMFGEDRMLAALAAEPPDYIALVHHDPREYGFFGLSYGREILLWVQGHYRPISLIGAPPLLDDRFGIALLQRLDARLRSDSDATGSSPSSSPPGSARAPRP